MSAVAKYPTVHRCCVGALIALLASFEAARGSDLPGVAIAAAPAAHLSGRQASALLAEMAAQLDPVTAASRSVLLGKAEPGKTIPPVIQIHKQGGRNVAPIFPADPNAGPGRRIVHLSYRPRGLARTGWQSYLTWSQSDLKQFVELLRDRNHPVLASSARFSALTDQLLFGTSVWKELSPDFVPTHVKPGSSWPAHCLRSLNEAVASRDLARVRRWAAELHSAAFALQDLHRWLEFLSENHLAALAFQAHCESLFGDSDRLARTFNLFGDESYFPGGSYHFTHVCSYLELERQAEHLFSVRKEYLLATRPDVPLPPHAMWMPPDLRGPFLQLREKLCPANQVSWDQAARSPYERSYLANMLYRAIDGGYMDRLSVVFQRFDAGHPQSSVHELMDLMHYRGGDWYAGFERADRFHPRLMSAAYCLQGTDEQSLAGARELTVGFFGGWQNYAGGIITLREALDQGKFDCVRATDMVGALYRNAGQAGLYNVRWHSGTAGHSVAAAEVHINGRTELLIADGLERTPAGREIWSAEYFRKHKWPTGYPREAPPAYAMVLSGRGLDSYVFVEGYILRGPNKNLFMRHGIPYLPHRTQSLRTRTEVPPTVIPSPHPRTP